MPILLALFLSVAQAKDVVPTWEAMPTLVPSEVRSAKDIERALKRFPVKLFEPTEGRDALWATVYFDDRKEEQATWAVTYRYDRSGDAFSLSAVKTYGDRGPAAPVATDEPLPVDFLIDYGALDGPYGNDVRPCLRTVRPGWCSAVGGDALHVHVTPSGRGRLLETEELTEWAPMLARLEAADVEEATELLDELGLRLGSSLLANHPRGEAYLAALRGVELPPRPEAELASERKTEPSPELVAEVDRTDLAAIRTLPQVLALTASTPCGDGLPVPGGDLCELSTEGIDVVGKLYGRFDPHAEPGSQRDVWLVYQWPSAIRADLGRQLDTLDLRATVRGRPDGLSGGSTLPTGWSWSTRDKRSGVTRHAVVGGNPTRVRALGTAPLPGTTPHRNWDAVETTLADPSPELRSWASALRVVPGIPEPIQSAASAAIASAPPNTIEPSWLGDWLAACDITETRWSATLDALTPMIDWDRDKWTDLRMSMPGDCDDLDRVVGLVEDPLAHTVDEAMAAGAFLNAKHDYLGVHLAAPILKARAQDALERRLIGHALALEAELAELREPGRAADLSATPSGRGLLEFGEAPMPGWPEDAGADQPMSGPRSTRPELRIVLRPGEPVVMGDDNCIATTKRETQTVTRTVTVEGRAGSQAAKDRLYSVGREIDALELQLQRLGERRMVTDYVVERDGTARSGLVTEASPEHDRIEGKLAQLRAEQGALMEAAIGTLPTERTITEQVQGDTYEQLVCTGRARQAGELVLGDQTMPVHRVRTESLHAHRAPGDAEAMRRLSESAADAAGEALSEEAWDVAGSVRVFDWMAIDEWILEQGHAHSWTPEEREAERQFLREQYTPLE